MEHARPDWPSQDDFHLFWAGLNSEFQFAHHPAHPDRNVCAPSYFSPPEDLQEKLLAVLADSLGGSVLVTGYRGTGKTSLVNASLAQLELTFEKRQTRRQYLVRVDVNLSTVTTTYDVLLLTMEALFDRLTGLSQDLSRELDEGQSRHALPYAEFTRTGRPPRLSEESSQRFDQALAACLEGSHRRLAHLLRSQQEKTAGVREERAAALSAELAAQLDEWKSWRDSLDTHLATLEKEVRDATVGDRDYFAAETRRFREQLREWNLWLDGLRIPALARSHRKDDLGHRLLSTPLGKLLAELGRFREELRSIRTERVYGGHSGVAVNQPNLKEQSQEDSRQVFEREGLSYHQSQLVDLIKRVEDLELDAGAGATALRPALVFVFDELDKLMPALHLPATLPEEPVSDLRQTRKLFHLQQIVAELKFFLSQSPSHQIFIAGKDVDDSWAEDQNKGDGLFESIFVANIYVPSIFSLHLRPCAAGAGAPIVQRGDVPDPARELAQFYLALARELGIQKHSWTYNTALLILPHLAEYEVLQLLFRIKRRRETALHAIFPKPTPPAEPSGLHADLDQVKAWINAVFAKIEYAISPGKSLESWSKRGATSERTCRRLRVLLEYLTYKGRGIPRKILREFYTMVSPCSAVKPDAAGAEKLGPAGAPGSVRYVIAFHQHVLQKMNFYAGIMEDLEVTYAEMRGLNDKGRVSIFHVIDYMLKFYATGFSLRDMEYANFMTTREEFFPSRQLAALIIRSLDGRRWRRKDSRSPEFRLLHSVVHDLGVMFLRYGPEQMELRHTQSDFKQELERLKMELADLQSIPSEQRLTPVHAILRFGRIQEMIGNHFEARLAYYRALRWLRGDLHRLEQHKWQSVKMVRDEWLRNEDETLQLNEGPFSLSASFIQPFLGYITEALLASGRLHEEVGEYPAALQYFLEAELLYRTHAKLCLHWLDDSPPVKAVVNEDLAPTLLASLYATFTWPADSTETPAVAAVTTDQLAGSEATTDARRQLEQLRVVLAPRGSMPPLNLSQSIVSLSSGLVEALNHAAVAYSKMWERARANDCLLRALYHLRIVEDYHGLIDQAYFIGQSMVRRRDFRAAAAWYLLALRFIDEIKKTADGATAASAAGQHAPRLQSGAQWQTPSAAAETHAHILAALGDIYFATGGLAFLDQGDIERLTRSQTADSARILALQRGARVKVGEVFKQMHLPVFDDRLEEFFHTYSRYVYRSIGDTVSATDVYLRQAETRVDSFCSFMALLEQDESALTPELLQEAKYGVLNTWRSFWRAARSLLFRQLTTPTGLTRDAVYEWGRVSGFRRTGYLLRMVGEILRELALHKANGKTRRLLFGQSRYNFNHLGEGDRADIFYGKFVSSGAGSGLPYLKEEHMSAEDVEAFVRQRVRDLIPEQTAGPGHAASAADPVEERLRDFWDEKGQPNFLERLGVNRAAEDMRTIFAYVSDKSSLLDVAKDETDRWDDQAFNDIGPRSPLYRINGSNSATGASEPALPLGFLIRQHLTAEYAEDVVKDFRLLALSEKALISAYLAYRDCIPDYNYACATLAVGELYLTALYKLGIGCADTSPAKPNFQELEHPLERLCELAKRYILKAIDVLKREREQNRNTYHLISEALFNLADLVLIRLALLPDTGADWSLFGNFKLKATDLWQDSSRVEQGGRKNECSGDRVAEDLRRQICEAYTQGLILVQDEIDEYSSRFRAPPEAYYAHRNLMDPVLHFRIARAARMRHIGARPVITKEDNFVPTAGFDPAALQREWEQISRHISTHQSPQRQTDRWFEHLRILNKQAERVRSDRSPLTFEGEKLCWIQPGRLTERRLLLFHEFYRTSHGPQSPSSGE